MNKFTDTDEGARAFMISESTFREQEVLDAKTYQDPHAPGVWAMVLRDEDRTGILVYGLGTEDPDFEEVEFGPSENWIPMV